MKIYLQIVDTRTGIYQCGMIDEPVMKGEEVNNALGHFGISPGSCSVEYQSNDSEIYRVDGTTKVVSVIKMQ